MKRCSTSLPDYQINTSIAPKQGWYTFCFIRGSENNVLLFFNPDVSVVPKVKGSQCTFAIKEELLPKQVREGLSQYPLFYQDGNGPFIISKKELCTVSGLFDKLASHMGTAYIYKDQLLINLTLQLIHFVIKHFVKLKKAE